VSKNPSDTPAGGTRAHPEADPQYPSIIQPIMDDLKAHTSPTQLPVADEVAPPRGPRHPPQPAELDQDPGGGYNADGTYPQT
jgi:hypothetical protein